MKKIYSFFLFALVWGGIIAQDIHFSQFNQANLWLNPATAGLVNGTARLQVNHRNQWFSAVKSGFFKSPYITTALSFDMPINIREDVLGVGLFLANDQQGANTFTGAIANVAISYIKTLGRKRNHRLSAGLQGGYTFYSVKTGEFQFANQFMDNQFVSSLSNNENIARNNAGYFNMNAGLYWIGELHRDVNMFLGASFYNVSAPKFNILANQSTNWYWRWNVHGGVDIRLGEKYHLIPTGMFTRMGSNDQLNTGLFFGYDFSKRYEKTVSMNIGFFNRIHNLTKGVTTDALIPYFGFNSSGFRFGFSYDATISELKNSGSGVGSLEMHLAYIFTRANYYNRNKLIYPRL